MKTVVRIFAVALVACAMALPLMAQSSSAPLGSFTAAALNVDGMPQEVKILNLVPITLNPDAKESAGATAIGQKLLAMDYDFIGVSEDFNYHSELMAACGSVYEAGTDMGGIVVTAESYARFIGNRTVFDADGLNILYKRGAVSQANESVVHWDLSNGKTSNGSDELIDKGFRYYTVTVLDSIELDVYIVHMDAETDPEDMAARDSNIRQLARAIINSSTKRPILVMGDTNCRYTRDSLLLHFFEPINADSRFSVTDTWIEHVWEGTYPELGASSMMVYDPYYGEQYGEVVDKIFYINNNRSPYQLQATRHFRDTTFVDAEGEPLTDHKPVVAEFAVYKNDTLSVDTITDFESRKWNGDDPTAMAINESADFYIYHPLTRKYLSVEGDALSVTDAPQTVWTIAKNSQAGGTATVNMTANVNGTVYYFYLNRTGIWGSYSAEPKLSTDVQTILLMQSATNTTFPAYKLHRTKDTERYLNYNGSFTAAKSKGEQNDWVFISMEQFTSDCIDITYGKIPQEELDIVPSPGLNELPGADEELSIGNSGFATYYHSALPYIMPEGVNGYIFSASAASSAMRRVAVAPADDELICEQLRLTYEAGDFVPANEPLVLTGATGSYTIEHFASHEVDFEMPVPSEDNLLRGTDEATTVAVDAQNLYYTFGLRKVSEEEYEVGMFRVPDDSDSFTNGAHEAYLLLSRDEFTDDDDQLTAPEQYVFLREDAETITTSAESAEASQVQKLMRGGQLIIRKGGAEYTVLGLRL